MDWNELFGLTVSPLELIVRGTAMYWFIFVLFRMVLRRGVGGVGIADVLLLVLIADAAQNGMAGDYRSVTDGMILVSTIIGWSIAFDWLAYRFPRIGALLEPPPLPLVQDGRMNRRNMRLELLSEEELLAKLREQGVDRLEDVKRATMESDGNVSVIRRSGEKSARPRRKLPT
ncbi:MAG TPA: YetF domain-containing protein [Burkholderiales bacterium]|nr:YetF domain-containing protein [Burkholderiales bacterium]